MPSTYQPLLQYGSRGDAVRRLQSLLNQRGYSLDVDGGYGPLTRAAVTDYQKKNRLRVDGVVGSETWGHLLSTPAAAGTAAPTTGKQVLSGVSDETADRLYRLEQGYSPSAEALAARSEYDSLAAARPAAYRSSFDEQLAALYDEIAGREPFSYDPAADVTYQRAAEDYQRRGRTAMEDTVGRGAALTGGYGSSYAQAAGQQAYGRQLEELAALIPQLEENARARYEARGAAAERQYDRLLRQQQEEYDRWQQGQEDWRDALESARSAAETAESADRAAWQQALRYYADRAAAEQKASDAAAERTGTPVRANNGRAPSPESGKGSLSSTAAESLSRAMGNYLTAGNADAAESLARQYAARLTPAQKKSFRALFARHGVQIAL